jgi:hypothetical protein
MWPRPNPALQGTGRKQRAPTDRLWLQRDIDQQRVANEHEARDVISMDTEKVIEPFLQQLDWGLLTATGESTPAVGARTLMAKQTERRGC